MAPRLLPLLYVVSAALSALILAPILRGGYLLYRDAVSTPRSFVTDTTLGLGGTAPRAVPQDWVIAELGRVVDGGVLVAVITAAALTLAGVGYGRLAARLVPSAGRSGALAAATVSIWNPYVAERLLQGHWSLLVSYATLGWVVVAALDVVGSPHPRRRWAPLVAGVCSAGFTPTGSVLAGIVMVVVLATRPAAAERARTALIAGGIWVLGALPWLTATVVGAAPATTGPDGFAVFGIRAEPGLGTVGTVLGLGGIWNADAVPASRTIWWAAVATAALLLVIGLGTYALWRERTTLDRVVAALAGLAAATAILVAVTAIGPIAGALSQLSGTVPGVGLFRDTQKFLALLVPFFALAAAAAVGAARRWVPVGFALAAATLLVLAPLPDLAWGVGGKVEAVTYPADWSTVARLVTADHGSVAVWPVGTVRRYPFADSVSLNPLPRMVRAPVTDSGELTVDGVVVDPATGPGADVDRVLTDGGSPRELAGLGVGWVVVENDAPPPTLARTVRPVFAGEDLTLYRIPGAITDAHASSAARAAVLTAHVIWSTTLVVALVVSLSGARRRTRP